MLIARLFAFVTILPSKLKYKRRFICLQIGSILTGWLSVWIYTDLFNAHCIAAGSITRAKQPGKTGESDSMLMQWTTFTSSLGLAWSTDGNGGTPLESEKEKWGIPNPKFDNCWAALECPNKTQNCLKSQWKETVQTLTFLPFNGVTHNPGVRHPLR